MNNRRAYDYSNIPLTQPTTCSERRLVPASLPVLCCRHKVPEAERLMKRGSLSSQLWMAKHFLKPWNSLNIPTYADLRCVFGFSFRFAFEPSGFDCLKSSLCREIE